MAVGEQDSVGTHTIIDPRRVHSRVVVTRGPDGRESRIRVTIHDHEGELPLRRRTLREIAQAVFRRGSGSI